MNPWKPSITAAAVILCLVSVLLPAAQWAVTPVQIWAKALAGITGAALAICKLGFFPVAWHHLTRSNWLPGITLLVFAAALLWANVESTYQLLNQQQQQRLQMNLKNSQYHQALTVNLQDITAQIQTVNRLAAKDAENGYRQRAYNSAETLNKLRQQRADLQQQLKQIESPAYFAADESLTENPTADTPKKLNASQRHTDGLFYIALTIHLGCVLAVLVCGAWQPINPPEKQPPAARKRSKPQATRKPEKQPAQPAEKTAEPQPAPAPTPARQPAAQKLDDDQQALAEQIKAGEYGDRPGMKALITAKAIKGGHKRIKPVFDHLIEQNILRQNGQRFELIQQTI